MKHTATTVFEERCYFCAARHEYFKIITYTTKYLRPASWTTSFSFPNQPTIYYRFLFLLYSSRYIFLQSCPGSGSLCSYCLFQRWSWEPHKQ
jgi:hypothetical protein